MAEAGQEENDCQEVQGRAAGKVGLIRGGREQELVFAKGLRAGMTNDPVDTVLLIALGVVASVFLGLVFRLNRLGQKPWPI
jgi:hypothetical protein